MLPLTLALFGAGALFALFEIIDDDETPNEEEAVETPPRDPIGLDELTPEGDSLMGSEADDVIRLGQNASGRFIDAAEGDDSVLLEGETQSTTIAGGDGDDTLSAGMSDLNASMIGGEDDDLLQIEVSGLQGTSSLEGGAGDDTIKADLNDIRNNVSTLVASGGSGADLFDLSVTSDSAYGDYPYAPRNDVLMTITDFDPAEDVLSIDPNGSTSGETTFQSARVVPGNTGDGNYTDVVLQYGSPDTSYLVHETRIRLEGVTGLTSGDVQIEGGVEPEYLDQPEPLAWRDLAHDGRFFDATHGDDHLLLRQNDFGVVRTGEGNDLIEFSDLYDVTIEGGAGDDTFSSLTDAIRTTMRGQDGNDVFDIDLRPGPEEQQANHIDGGAGDDTINASISVSGYGFDIDELTGGAGADLFNVEVSAPSVPTEDYNGDDYKTNLRINDFDRSEDVLVIDPYGAGPEGGALTQVEFIALNGGTAISLTYTDPGDGHTFSSRIFVAGSEDLGPDDVIVAPPPLAMSA